MAKGHGHGKGGMRKEARTPENLIRNAGKQEPKGGMTWTKTGIFEQDAHFECGVRNAERGVGKLKAEGFRRRRGYGGQRGRGTGEKTVSDCLKSPAAYDGSQSAWQSLVLMAHSLSLMLAGCATR